MKDKQDLKLEFVTKTFRDVEYKVFFEPPPKPLVVSRVEFVNNPNATELNPNSPRYQLLVKEFCLERGVEPPKFVSKKSLMQARMQAEAQEQMQAQA